MGGPWERILFVLLDGLGLRGVVRHGDHPFLKRVHDEGCLIELTTQFPSTTTAHVTTLHTGQPVGVHGLYEWNVLEPSLGRVIRPLPFALFGDTPADSLAELGLDPAKLVPGPSFYDLLGNANVGTTLHQPATFSPSTYDRAAATGAVLAPFGTMQEGLADAVAA